MAGFDSPNVNDFLAQLQVQSDRIASQFAKAKNAINCEVAAAGATGSSRQLLLILDALEEHIERGVALSLGELRRALDYPELDPVELRQLIGPRLDDLATRLIDMCRFDAKSSRHLQSPQIQEMIGARILKLLGNIQFWLRQFDIGWDDPVKPESLTRPLDPQ